LDWEGVIEMLEKHGSVDTRGNDGGSDWMEGKEGIIRGLQLYINLTYCVSHHHQLMRGNLTKITKL